MNKFRPTGKSFRIYTRRPFSSANVNNDEVNKFSSVGGNWWNRSSIMGTGPLHDMNPPRVEFIRHQLAITKSTELLFETDQIRDLKILDVGCGGGLLSESLARLGAKVTAIDPSAENISVAMRHSSHDPLTRNIIYKRATIEDIVASGEQFDAVCSLEVVEHVDDPSLFVKACAQSVVSGGSLFLSTMNRTRKARLMTIVGAEYILGLVPTGTHDWNKYITPEELQAMIEDSGSPDGTTAAGKCVVKAVNGLVLQKPQFFNPSACKNVLRNWTLSANDTDVNYIVHAVKL